MRFALGFLAASALFFAAPLVAGTLVRVEPGKGGDLAARVLILERAVAQLQGAKEVAVVAPAVGAFTCVLKTPFDGSFSQAADSESTARANVLSECKLHAKGSLYCEEKGVSCGKK